MNEAGERNVKVIQKGVNKSVAADWHCGKRCATECDLAGNDKRESGNFEEQAKPLRQ